MAADNDKSPDISELERSIQQKLQKLEETKQETIVSSKPYPDWWSVHNMLTISSAILMFGCVVMILATYLLFIGKQGEDVLKLFGTIIIIISAIFLVVAGYSDIQIAPIVGLLGTIAGYLLGRKNMEDKEDSDESSKSIDESKTIAEAPKNSDETSKQLAKDAE